MKHHLYRLFHSLGGTPWVYDTVSARLIRLEGLPKEVLAEQVEAYLLRQNLIRSLPKSNGVAQKVSEEEYLSLLDGYASRLTLELTQQCNLRCSYCVYSGKFSGRRTHSTRQMSLDTALGAIELFRCLSHRMRHVSICFYGGEALLCFDTIQKLVPLTRDRLSKRVIFHISTNGTLLDDAFFQWMRKNPDVFLDVTLNGLEHDRYRRYIDGSPTLADILRNIRHLRKRYPDMAESRLNFICNAGNNRELESLWKFYEAFGATPALITGIEFPEDRTLLTTPEDTEIWKTLAWHYIRKDDAFLRCFFEPGLLRIHHRRAMPDETRTILEGTCLPLLSNLFVNAAGEITLCEKVCGPLLGSVSEGLNQPDILKLMRHYVKALDKRCDDCWAQRLCAVCYRDLNPSGGIHPDICAAVRKDLTRELSLYASVCEEVPERLRHYDEMMPVLENLDAWNSEFD